MEDPLTLTVTKNGYRKQTNKSKKITPDTIYPRFINSISISFWHEQMHFSKFRNRDHQLHHILKDSCCTSLKIQVGFTANSVLNPYAMPGKCTKRLTCFYMHVLFRLLHPVLVSPSGGRGREESKGELQKVQEKKIQRLRKCHPLRPHFGYFFK